MKRIRSRRFAVVVGAVCMTVLTLVTPACDPAEIARLQSFVGQISPVDEARLGLSWRPGCPVGPADLRLVTLSYWGFDGEGHQGELIVHRTVAGPVVDVFRRLWFEKFPINRMETAERFASPADFAPDGTFVERHEAPDTVNDTSAYFCRPTTGGGGWSQHSYGTAIDINPVQNPYIKRGLVIPINGVRDARAPGTITSKSVVVTAFRRAGFRWGGVWRSLKDYMHFSVTGR